MKAIKLILLLSIIIFSGYIISLAINNNAPVNNQNIKNSNNHLSINDFTSTDYIDGKIQSSITASSASVQSRKFSIFKINRLDELILKEVVFKIYTNESDINKIDPFEMMLSAIDKNLSENKDFLKIEMSNSEIQIYYNNNISLKIFSKTTNFNFKKNNTKIKNLIIENIDNKTRLACKSATWHAVEKYFTIDGDYLSETPNGRTRGENGKILLNSEAVSD